MITVLSSLKEYWNIPLKKRRFITVGEAVSTHYKIIDNQEELIDVIELFTKNKIKIIYNPPRDIKKIKQNLLLRKSAAKKLIQAAKKLPKGYSFKISEGYRPLWFQKQEFDKIYKYFVNKYPKWTKKQIWEQTTMYIADPKLSPPHASGGTFDLTIVNRKDEELDMGTKLNSVNSKSNTFNEKISKKQMANRLILFSTLEKVGFVNIPSEWWHYSYGDQYWAIYYKKAHAIYGKVDLKNA